MQFWDLARACLLRYYDVLRYARVMDRGEVTALWFEDGRYVATYGPPGSNHWYGKRGQ